MVNKKKVIDVSIEDTYYPVNNELLQFLYQSRKLGYDIVFTGQVTQNIDQRIKILFPEQLGEI